MAARSPPARARRAALLLACACLSPGAAFQIDQSQSQTTLSKDVFLALRRTLCARPAGGRRSSKPKREQATRREAAAAAANGGGGGAAAAGGAAAKRRSGERRSEAVDARGGQIADQVEEGEEED